ncbi:MAG: glycine--tRNA ligase subunit beta, partial [Candidatus Omnitrophica bacterium]|nr:glycine--tRNA ligase subunit beta [Candidatus Omnitrophota bacterium]
QIDEELAHMNAQLVEEPFFLAGTFSQEYLELPAEVLASCMKKNQKICACYDAKGRLGSQASLADSQAGRMKNQFVAVMNGKRNGLAKIRSDYENVLDSRLKDARYFYELDTRESFETKKSKLAELVYLGKLGSVLDKTERLEKLAPEFAKATGHQALASDLARVAALSKIDLVTHLVYEMPDLQGIVGREYALEAKEKNEVALAIGTQYLPKNLTEDHLKVGKSMSLLGALFGIMDRLDLIVGAFGTGMEPSGSKDPFALRRAGGIVVKLIRAFGISFSLQKVIRANVDLYGNKVKLDEMRLGLFIRDRIIFELGVKPGTRAGEILTSVIASNVVDLADVFKRFDALTGMDEKVLIKAAKVIQRTANMLKGYGKTPGEPKEELLTEAEEKKLFELFRAQAKDVTEPLEKGEYEKATRVFADLFAAPLNDFFDHVLVNAEDAVLRENRMALVAKVNRLYTAKIADLSALSRIDEE